MDGTTDSPCSSHLAQDLCCARLAESSADGNQQLGLLQCRPLHKLLLLEINRTLCRQLNIVNTSPVGYTAELCPNTPSSCQKRAHDRPNFPQSISLCITYKVRHLCLRLFNITVHDRMLRMLHRRNMLTSSIVLRTFVFLSETTPGMPKSTDHL